MPTAAADGTLPSQRGGHHGPKKHPRYDSFAWANRGAWEEGADFLDCDREQGICLQ